MGGKSGGGFRVTRHYLSVFYGICATGRDVELLEIKFGDKLAWRGSMKINGQIEIDKPNLFGGDEKEGGIRGIATWLNGNANQVLPAYLAQKFGKTPATCPGYRGYSSLFFTGVPVPDPAPESETDASGNPTPSFFSFLTSAFKKTDGDSGRGFMVGANNPYLKAPSARLRRPPQGLNPSISMVRVSDSSEGVPQYAANAAHIVFEAMTNPDWGMGESYSMFNIESFEQCAQTLYDEKLGLNIIWTRQSKIEDFIKTILDHVQGGVFIDPRTGKHTMKLVRSDYDINNLQTISPSNAKLSGFKMKVWGEISNEVSVTWTNPENAKEETVTVQDLAAIAAQGGITSTSRNYHGIADQGTAIAAGERDLGAIAYPLASCTAEVSKELWKTVADDCVILTWPRHGINSSVFRVNEVKRGSTSRTITLSLVEDVFSLATASYATVEETEWVDPSLAPQPLVNTYFFTTPAFLTVGALGLNDISELQYPECVGTITAGADSADDIGYELIGYSTTATGSIKQETLGPQPLTTLIVTGQPLVQEVKSVLSITSGFTGSLPEVGDFLLIGDGAEEDSEIVIVIGVNGSDFTLVRGMLDTTPKYWPSGTKIILLSTAAASGDLTRRSAFEEADYHLQTITTAGILPLEDTPKQTLTLSERPHKPNRPANVKVEGVAFGTYDMANAPSLNVTWVNRNRTTEATQAPLWDDASASPETGQTTSIAVLRYADRVEVNRVTGLTGTSANLPKSTFAGETDVILRFLAERDGLESLQGHEIRLLIANDAIILEGDEAGNLLALENGDRLAIEEV